MSERVDARRAAKSRVVEQAASWGLDIQKAKRLIDYFEREMTNKGWFWSRIVKKERAPFTIDVETP